MFLYKGIQYYYFINLYNLYQKYPKAINNHSIVINEFITDRINDWNEEMSIYKQASTNKLRL